MLRRFLLITLLAAVAACSRAPEKVRKAGMALAEEDRVFIAEIESQGLVLSRRGFPAVAAAIRGADAGKLGSFFAGDFQGELFADEHNGGSGRAGLTVQFRSAAGGGHPLARVNSDAFAGRLGSMRSRFAAESEVEVALTSLAPVSRADLKGAWTAGCVLRISGLLRDGGPGELIAKLELKLNTIPDADAIASAAGWIGGARFLEEQFAFSPAPLLREFGGDHGINRWKMWDNWTEPAEKRSIQTGGVFVADVDENGEDDLFVTDISGPALYLNTGKGQFKDATEGSGLPANLKGIGAVAIADFDGDGHVDMILPKQVLRGSGTGKFEDITERMKFDFGRLTGFSVADYDRDGRLDLYVSRFNGIEKSAKEKTSWIDGPGGPGNQLWRNLGDWKFEEVSEKANAQAGRRSVFTSVWMDANDDGWPDVYVINEFGGGILLVNRGDGTFREQHLIDDAGDFGSMGMAAADYNNDGRIDIYTANMYSKAGRRIMENLPDGSYDEEVFKKMKRFVTGSELYTNGGDLTFSRSGKAARVHAVGWAYGAAFVDLDSDGFLDLYGTAGFMSVSKTEPDG